MLFRDKYEYESKNDVAIPDFIQLYLEHIQKHGSTQEKGLTSEQYDEFYADYCEQLEKFSDDSHYLGKYQYPDFYEKLLQSGLATDTINNRVLALNYKKANETWYIRGFF